MSVSVVFEEKLEIPYFVTDLESFRSWFRSLDFPRRGRIDYIGGRIEVDMSPADLLTHGSPKSEIHRVLAQIVKTDELGLLFLDRARISNQGADLSAEPDIVFVSWEALESGRVELIPAASGKDGRFIEMEGGPDLIVEIVSDSSVEKDLKRLPAAYYKAGVQEFWLVDARADELHFEICHSQQGGLVEAPADDEGWHRSDVLASEFQFDRARGRMDLWTYELRQRRPLE